MTVQPIIDENKLNEFVGRFAGDLGAVLHATTVLIGDKLGLYKAMADSEPITAEELAERTGTGERYMREWLSAQAASGYVEYDPATDHFRLSEEQAFALTNEHNALFAPGGLQLAASTIKDADAMAETIPARARVSAGTSTTTTSTKAPSGSSGPATLAAWWTRGYPRSKAWRISCGPARRWPTRAAGTGLRRSSWPRSIPTQPSSASTTTKPR
ncbi:hypothetical protein BH18ACT10_BH18ACT10_02010 [soil metagenome]